MGRAKGKGRKEHKKPFIANVSDRNERNVSVTVSLETKVGEMKRRLAAAEPTLRADRIMLFSFSPGHKLDDDEKTLADYEGITKHSQFRFLSTVHLIVELIDGSFFWLQTPTHETVKHTKISIERHDSVLTADSMVLVHNGAVLRDDDKLVERGVTEGSVLVCLVQRPEQAQHEARRWWKMARRLCDFCGKQGRISEPTFPRCGACSKRRYCDEACQRADWEALHSRRCLGIPRHPGVGPDGRLVPLG